MLVGRTATGRATAFTAALTGGLIDATPENRIYVTGGGRTAFLSAPGLSGMLEGGVENWPPSFVGAVEQDRAKLTVLWRA